MISMKKTYIAIASIVLLLVGFASEAYAAPSNFQAAKLELRKYVYFDRMDGGEFYCGCDFSWKGANKSGSFMDIKSCGYVPRKNISRASRGEIEHLTPMENIGRSRQCWQNGGRKNCNQTDPVFNAIEADMHNHVVSVGEYNGDRSNFRPAMLPGTPQMYGACKSKVDFAGRKMEPRDEVKGMMARAYFYIFDRYDIRMSSSQEQLLMAWNKMYPVSAWEIERDRRIAARMGHHNPFVTGTRRWERNHKNSAEGVVSAYPRAQQVSTPAKSSYSTKSTGDLHAGSSGIRGNKNSKVYHLPSGCPSYNRMAPHNIVAFDSEQQAAAAGYRKAGNCS